MQLHSAIVAARFAGGRGNVLAAQVSPIVKAV